MRPPQTRPTTNDSGRLKQNVTEIKPGEYTIVTRKDPFSIEDRHGATVEKMVTLGDQRLQQQIADTKKRLDTLNEERNALLVPPRSSKPDLTTILFGRGSAAPSKEETDRAAELDMQILETEDALTQYEDLAFRRDVVKLYGQAGIDGWDKYLRHKEEKELAEAERLANETWQDKLGRYMSGNTRDTTLPFHVDELQLAEGHRAQERGKREPDDRWTNAQKAGFGYLWGSSPESAGNYAAQLNKQLDTEEAAAEVEKVREWSVKNPVNGALATAGSILLGPIAGTADILNDVTAYGTLGYIPEPDGSADLWDVTQAATSAISEKMNSWGTLPKAVPVLGDKGLGDVYGLGVNVVQSYMAATSGGPAQAVITFIGPAAAAAKDDALRRGADDETALTYGAVIGLIEAGAEAIGAENVTRLISSGGLKALLSSPGMGEAMEEGVASLAGFVADVLLMRENSEFFRRVAEYEEEGKSRAGAVSGAAWDTLEDILYDSLAGGLSGEAHMGMAKVWGAVSKAFGGKRVTSGSARPATSSDTQPKAAASTSPQAKTSPDAGATYAGAEARTEPHSAGTMTNADIRDADAPMPDLTDAPKTSGDQVPYLSSDHWTGELEGLWTESATEAGNTGTVDKQQPLRYEDAVRQYVNGRGNASINADTALNSDIALNTDTARTADPKAGPATSWTPAVDTNGTQRTAPKPKAQVIAELAPKIQRPGITSGRATIAAEQTYADAEKRFGSNAQTVLEMLQPGQDPRRFLDGFQNAYFAGKMGSSAALKNSGTAAYLTEEQRHRAYDMGDPTANTGHRAILDIETSDGTMDSNEFWIGRSLGARAKNYQILLPNGEYVSLTEGSRITNVTTIAGKGRNRQIDQIDILLDRYGGSEQEWMKKKGLGYIDFRGESYLAELHWYEEPTVGKHEWKVKPNKDGGWFLVEDQY